MGSNAMRLEAARRKLQGIQGLALVAAVLMFLAAAVLQYAEEVPFLDIHGAADHLGLERHSVERLLMLLPIAYTGYALGLRPGVAASALALAVMLPQALTTDLERADALAETGTIMVVGGFVNVWFEEQRRKRQQREEMLLELHAAQEQLRSRLEATEANEQDLAAVNAISSIVSQSLEQERILKLATDRMMEMAGLESLLIFLLNGRGEQLILQSHRGVSEEVSTALAGGDSELNIRVAATGMPLVLDGGGTRALEQTDFQPQLVVPLWYKGRALGSVWATSAGRRPFAAREISLLCAACNVIAIALENARLYRDERQMAEQLRTSEKRYRDLFEGAHEAIWVEDLHGHILMANRACASLTGYPLQELIGAKVGTFLPGQASRRSHEIRLDLLRGGARNGAHEERMVRKDGSEAILQMSMSLVSLDGQDSAYQLIARDITEERRMEENLRFYLHQVTRAQEEERKRIARELHDDTAQELVALSRQMDTFVSQADGISRRQVETMERMRGRINGLLEGVRRFSQDLRPSVIDDLGLLPALEWLVSDLQEQFEIPIGIAIVGAERRFSPDMELVLFRIAQEALRNVWRHAQASRAWLTLEFGDGKTTLSVRDNGKGFAVPRNPVDLPNAGKLGLAGMAERARLIGGRLSIGSAPGEGTIVTVEVDA